MTHLATLILLLPGLTALLALLGAGLLPAHRRDPFAMALTTLGMLVCALLSWVVFVEVGWGHVPPQTITLLPWLQTEFLHVEFGIYLDKLTATMLVVVTSVSACVHVYSIGYMAQDPAKPRFFALLSFFTFTMLLLVTAPNLLQMFLGWEGVGVASYLLIGFWYQKESANAASMKAFVVNRVADAFLLLGMLVLAVTFGSLDYLDIFAQLGTVGAQTFPLLGWEIPTLELAALLLFFGAMGKSAQFGLHVWLPDAMEGPTPVSALIHAATMVTAGVFLLCRVSPLLAEAPLALTAVAYIGALTAIFAATVGLTQHDIKRVIAYSTCSQLGYMFFAVGVGAYGAAMFHLTTHAFFKALLFLGAGSVIHGLHHEQDLTKMGGVRLLFPVTYALMWLGSLALAGIPPFAGFFSKELILEYAFADHSNTGYLLYTLGAIGALLTAFYSFRLIFLAFHGKHRGAQDALKHAHESPLVMLVPMLPLALGAVFGGYLLQDMADPHWWAGVLPEVVAHHPHVPKFWKYAPLGLALGGIWLAFRLYIQRPHWPQQLAQTWAGLYHISFHKWYVDEAYQWLVVGPYRQLAKGLSAYGDRRGIDGVVNGLAHGVWALGQRARVLQTGYVFSYAFLMVGAVVLALGYLLYKLSGGHE